MTLAVLQQLGREWQEKLNLREWSISYSWGAKGLEGCCFWHPEELHADVEVSRRARAKEQTLVHELLHVVLQGHLPCPGGEYDVHLERAINRISAAFVPDVKE